MSKGWIALLIILSGLWANGAENYVGFESIVQDLSKSQTQLPRESQAAFDLSSVKIHFAINFVNSRAQISPASSTGVGGFTSFNRGYEFSLGIDLLNPRWIAEGSVRSYGSDKRGDSEIALQEFDLKIVHLMDVAPRLQMRLGGGLAARYIEHTYTRPGEDVTSSASGGSQRVTEEFSTPATVILAGLDYSVSTPISVGIDASYRSSLIDDSPDKSALDFGVKLTTHF